MSYKHMEEVMDAAAKEPTAGKAAATVINGIAALIHNAGTDPDALAKAVRLIRREAGALEEIIDGKAPAVEAAAVDAGAVPAETAADAGGA